MFEPDRALEMAESIYKAGIHLLTVPSFQKWDYLEFTNYRFFERLGEGTLGTDEETFILLLAHQSFPQLQLVFREYANLAGKSFEQAVNSELGGDLKEALLTIGNFLNFFF